MIRFLKEKKEFLGIILFSVLTTLFIVPMSFLISNYSELEINLCYLTDQFLVISTFALIIAILIIRFLPEKFKKFLITILFVVGLFTYFEYLFIMPQLGQLKGNTLSFNNYILPIISEFIFIFAIIFSCIKFYKKDNFIKILYKISIFLIILQSAMFAFNLKPLMQEMKAKVTHNQIIDEDIYSFKHYNFDLSKYNIYSKNHNIVIVLMDAFGKGIFEELLIKYPEYKAIFKDFEFYSNTVSPHAQTSFAIHALFSGFELDDATHNEQYYQNLKVDFTAKNALLPVLKENGYNTYIYPFLSNMMYLNPSLIDNLILQKEKCKISDNLYGKLARNTIAFYMLPVFGKKSSHRFLTNLTLDKSQSISVDSAQYYIEDDFYNKFKNKMSTDNEKKVFKFYHLRGLHEPYKLDKEFKVKDIGDSVNDPVELTAKLYMEMVKNFLDRLKEEGIYDKSAIIFMSDHGSGRAISPLQSEKETNVNSLLLYKNFNQVQDEMKVVDDVYLGIEDIPGLILYSEGINKNKIDARNKDYNKEILENARNAQKIRLEDYKLKKEKFNHKTQKVEPSKIFTYFSVNKNATLTLSYIKGITNKKKYIVLDNGTNQYVQIVNYKHPEFQDETGKYFLTTINLNADVAPNGEYDLKLIWNNGGKYYEMPIGKLSIKDNLMKLLTPLFDPWETQSKIQIEAQSETRQIKKSLELKPFEYKYKIRGDVPSGLRELKMDGKTVNMYISNGYQVDQQEAYVVLENMKNPAEKYAVALPKDYTQIQSDKQYYRWVNFAANKIPKGKYEIKILVLYNNEYYNYKINEYIIDVFDKKVNFTDTGYWLTHKSE